MYKKSLLLILFILGFLQQSLAQKEAEFVYLHLDKGIYITGEHLWFKAYLLNKDINTIRSRILRTVLIDPTGKVIEQQQLNINKNVVAGNFKIPVDGPEGFYTIRAYTLAHLNLGSDAVFSQKTPVYRLQEKTVEAQQYKIDFPQQITIDSILKVQKIQIGELKIEASTDQAKYRKREKLQLTLETFSSDQRVASNVSVSITDISQLPFLPFHDITTYNVPNITNNSSQEFLPEKKINKTFEFYKAGQKIFPDEVFLYLKEDHKAIKGKANTEGFYWEFDDYYGIKEGQFFMLLDNQIDQNILAKEVHPAKNNFKAVADTRLLPYSPAIDHYLLLKRKELLINKSFQYENKIQADRLPLIIKERNTRKNYLIKKYANLKNIGEFLIEVVPPYALEKEEDQIRPFIKNMETKFEFPKPVYFLVGQTFSQDYEKILQIPIDVVESINFYDNVASLKPLGINYLANTGVIEIIFKEKQNTFESSIASYPIAGFNPTQHINIHKRPTSSPDFRSLIHWQSYVDIDKQNASSIEILLPDNIGTFLIQIEGISTKGEKGVLYFTIEIES